MLASSPQRDDQLLNRNMTGLSIATTYDNVEVVHRSDIVFVAVKPHAVRAVCAEIAPSVNKEKLTVSVALGVTIRSIESVLFQLIAQIRLASAAQIARRARHAQHARAGARGRVGLLDGLGVPRGR